jgi:flavin reductase
VTKSIGSDIANLRDDFRRSLRGFGSSVTIVTTHSAGRPFGLVATAVISLTFEPPLLAVAVNTASSAHDRIVEKNQFAVNILSSDDWELAHRFSKSRHEERFDLSQWDTAHLDADGNDGLPILVSAQSVFLCRLNSRLLVGSHSLLVGEVERVLSSQSIAPLLYCDGRYGAFNPIDCPATASLPLGVRSDFFAGMSERV